MEMKTKGFIESVESVQTVAEAAQDFITKASASFRYKKAVEAEMAVTMAEFNAKVERASRALVEHPDPH